MGCAASQGAALSCCPRSEAGAAFLGTLLCWFSTNSALIILPMKKLRWAGGG